MILPDFSVFAAQPAEEEESHTSKTGRSNVFPVLAHFQLAPED
jgi:hypothetical protein